MNSFDASPKQSITALSLSIVDMLASHIHLIFQAFFFGIPLILMVVESFWSLRNFQAVPDFTAANYSAVLFQPYLRQALINSLSMSSLVAFAAAVLSLPIAMSLLLIRRRGILFAAMFILLLPFLISPIVRALGWQTWLSNNGLLSSLYQFVALDALTKHGFLYTPIATATGLLSLTLPTASLLTYLTMRRIPDELYLAATNLRARTWHLIRYLLVPAALPGCLVGFLFAFVLSIADFIAPVTLGGGTTYYFSVAVVDRFKIDDWPQAAAMGVMLTILSVCVISAIFALLRHIVQDEGL